MMRPSSAMAALPGSGIREVMEVAWTIPDAILLGAGEPSFETPVHIRRAAAAAAESGFTKYTSNQGIPVLRDALAEKLRARNGFLVPPERIVVTAGGVEALFTSLASVVGPGDEVLIPDPGWPNTESMIHILRAEPVGYPLAPANGFVPHVTDLEALLTPRTRALVINSPSNPLGAVIGRERMRE